MDPETSTPPTAPVVTTPIADAVWQWFNDLMPGSPVGRDVNAWNHLHGALPELVRRLEALHNPSTHAQE